MKLGTIIFLAIYLTLCDMSSLPSYATENMPLAIYAKTPSLTTHEFTSTPSISIICSLFPVYDFAREVTGDLADVKLLLSGNAEPHEFEPSPLDVMALNNSDVFIYTGIYMEAWAEKISRSLSHTLIIDASENIELVNNDPHVWLDINHAQDMVMNISRRLCELDPEHSEIYDTNAKDYCLRLSELDRDFAAMRKDNTLVFAGEFSCKYFMDRYGFKYVSAYDGENEPSLRRMSEVIKYIRDNRVRHIFTDAVGISSITRSISEHTGAEILIFNSAHNVSREDLEHGITFIDIMRANYDSLKTALND